MNVHSGNGINAVPEDRMAVHSLALQRMNRLEGHEECTRRESPDRSQAEAVGVRAGACETPETQTYYVVYER